MKLVCFIMIFLLAGCHGFVINKRVVGSYHLIATDVEEDMALCYDDGGSGYSIIISQTVFAVGYSDNYIIVKQHPSESVLHINRADTDYYIVPIYPQDKYDIKKEIFGPFTLNQFEQKKKDLGLGSVEFTLVYKDLQ